MNIYVGNLPFSITEDKLKEAFTEYGTVVSVKIIIDKQSGKSRGFGFVEMANDSEAQKAIEQANGKELEGRNLKVNEAKRREEKGNSYSNNYQNRNKS
jgi:RNA recognition motif-containing protein